MYGLVIVAGVKLTFCQNKQAQGHDERVMAKFEEQQEQWSALTQQLATASGKHVDNVTLSTGTIRGQWFLKWWYDAPSGQPATHRPSS